MHQKFPKVPLLLHNMEQGAQQPGFNPFGNLPPEVSLVIDAIIARMVKKVEPEIQEIGKLLHDYGSAGLTVQMGVQPRAPIVEGGSDTKQPGAIVSPYGSFLK